MPAIRFSTAGIVLHWTMTLATAVAWALAQVVNLMPHGAGRTAVLGGHALVGLAVLALFLPRLLMRLRGLLGGAHDLLANLLLAAVALHVAATLFQHFIRRDDVAAQMIPVLAHNEPRPMA